MKETKKTQMINNSNSKSNNNNINHANLKLAKIEQYFRDELDNILTDLLNIFDDVELEIIRIFVRREELTFKIIQVFIDGVVPYEHLLEKEYNKFFSLLKFPTIADVNLDKLREIMLNERLIHNRDIIKKYFVLFIKLCKNYNLIKNCN